jgi:hypothetical protein
LEIAKEFAKDNDKFKMEETPEHFQCKITFETIRDPMLCASGVSYEEHVLMEHFKRNGHNDPVTRYRFMDNLLIFRHKIDLKKQPLIKNNNLKTAIMGFERM